MKDEYMENIKFALDQEKGNIATATEQIKFQNKRISDAQKEIKRLYNCRRVMHSHRKDPDIIKLCTHEGEDDEFDYMGYIDSGLGYAGKYCTRCGTLYNNPEYPAFTTKPVEPFKKDCEHKWVTYHNIKKMYPKPILCVYGRWCSVCGRLEEGKR